MRRKIIAVAASAAGVAALTLGSVGPAKAAEAPPGSITTAVCNALPTQISGLLAQVGLANSAVTTANSDMVAKQAALA